MTILEPKFMRWSLFFFIQPWLQYFSLYVVVGLVFFICMVCIACSACSALLNLYFFFPVSFFDFFFFFYFFSNLKGGGWDRHKIGRTQKLYACYFLLDRGNPNTNIYIYILILPRNVFFLIFFSSNTNCLEKKAYFPIEHWVYHDNHHWIIVCLT